MFYANELIALEIAKVERNLDDPEFVQLYLHVESQEHPVYIYQANPSRRAHDEVRQLAEALSARWNVPWCDYA